MSHLNIREAVAEDIPSIHHLLMELAEFERILDSVESTLESTRNALFGDNPSAKAIVAVENNEIIGTAIFFFNYSTFVGKKGLYLEDIIISPKYRNKGVGTKMMIELARCAVKYDCGRMEWTVLDWNNRAIEFYQNIGANIMNDWRLVRMNAKAIKKLSCT